MDKEDKRLIESMIDHMDIYEYVATEPKTVDEVKRYLLKDIGIPETTVRRYLSNTDPSSMGMLVMENDKLSINKELVRQVMDRIYERLDIKNVEEGLAPKIVYKDSLKVTPEPKREEILLLESYLPGLENDKDVIIKDEKTYKTRFAKLTMAVEFLKDWATDRKLESNRDKTVTAIMNDSRLTDQMKLQLYTRFGKYHGTEMEKLINYAADYGISAKWFIKVMESADKNDSFENIRDYLRLFAKTSEYEKKMELAKELIDGTWKIQLEYDGRLTDFMLVPVVEKEEGK